MPVQKRRKPCILFIISTWYHVIVYLYYNNLIQYLNTLSSVPSHTISEHALRRYHLIQYLNTLYVGTISYTCYSVVTIS